MATISEPAEAVTRWTANLDEQRIVLRGISWETYKRLSAEMGDATTLKAYNRGVLELMSPGLYHEDSKFRLHHLVQILTEELGLPCKWMGSTTFDDEQAERGLEPDTCYLLTAERVVAVRALPKGAAPPAPTSPSRSISGAAA